MKGVIRGKAGHETYHLDGREVTKAEFDRAFPDQTFDGDFGGATPAKDRPKLSLALAVHPDDIPAAREYAAKNGVPTDFAGDGRAIIRSRQHQKEYLKIRHLHNRDGGYGD